MKNFFAIAMILMLGITQTSFAQVSENTKLFKDVMGLDAHLFEEGFNQCKLDALDGYVAKDMEFFHDNGGMQNRAEFFQAMKKNVCSNPEGKPIRTLVAGSSQVFPLNNNGVLYGAIQQGVHRFHLRGKDTSTDGYTEAKFTNVWLYRDGKWQLKSALSYDHQQKYGKIATGISIKKAAPKPIKLFHIGIASLSLSLYAEN